MTEMPRCDAASATHTSEHPATIPSAGEQYICSSHNGTRQIVTNFAGLYPRLLRVPLPVVCISSTSVQPGPDDPLQ